MDKALEGIRVIDFTQDMAGPVCTEILAWLGADVIKIERPGLGDYRGRRLWWGDGSEADSFFFLLLNSSKRSITLDLKSDDGKEIAARLIRCADVVAENLRPGVMEQLGFGYSAVSSVNPRCIYASLKGFGSTGPYHTFKCLEPIAQATSGAMSMTGYLDGPPMFAQVNVGDNGAGVYLATAVLAALVQRQRTGRGQYVEVSMQEVVLDFARAKFSMTLTTNEPFQRSGNGPRAGAYADLLRCAGGGPNDFVYVMLPADSDEPFHALLAITGNENLLEDERFRTSAGRARYGRDLTAIIERWTEKRDKREVMRVLAERGLPCGAVLDTREVINDPHLRERGMVFDLEHPIRGRFTMIGCPMRLSDSPADVRRAPLLGEHTADVLTALAGCVPDEIERLRRKQVV